MRRARIIACSLLIVAMPVSLGAQPADATLQLQFDLVTGGRITGRFIAADARVVAVDIDQWPCLFAFDRMLPESAVRVMKLVLGAQRGGLDQLNAADYFTIATVELRHDQTALARRDFGKAARLDSRYRDAETEAFASLRADRRSTEVLDEPDDAAADAPAFTGASESIKITADPNLSDDDRRAKIIEGYKKVGDDLRARVGKDFVLVETPHFLVWTDWAAAERDDLSQWCEKMYAALASRFNEPVESNIFDGKCPIFCLRSRKRFAKVANLLDRYDVAGTLGYTSSDPNGHVHVVVCRQGGTTAARDSFASTLVHEGAHAFLHRYRGTRHVPDWLNEGLADHIAQSVLGDRCPNASAARLAHHEIVRGHYSIAPVFADDGMMNARYYPVAHGLVSYLLERSPAGFAAMIHAIKSGSPVEEALQRNYDLSIADLQRTWRESTP